MAIKVIRSVVGNVLTTSGPIIVVIPIFVLLATFLFFPLIDSVKLESNAPPEMIEAADTVMSSFTIIILIGMAIPIITTMMRTNVGRIIKTANIEKRMEKLKKMGSAQFIKQTKADLIDSSARGNKLYASDNIIKGRTLKFLIYNDKSTDREYISFVRENHNYADQAMASKFHLSVTEYDRLRVENEA